MRSEPPSAAPPVRPTPAVSFARFGDVPPRVKWLISLLSFLTVSQGFYYVYVTAYLPEQGVSGEAVGLILGTSAASVVLSAIPLGILSDRRGRRVVFLLGTMGLPPALLVYAFTSAVIDLILAAIVIGVAQGAFLTTWNAMIADQTTLENRDHAFSLSFVVNIVANGVGASVFVLFPALSSLTGASLATLHHDALLFFAGLACLSPISLAFLLRGFEEVSYPKVRVFHRGRKMNLLLKFSLLNGLIGLGAGFIIPLIATWLWLKFSVPDTFSGPLLAVSNMTVGFAALWSTGLAKRYGPVKAIALTQGEGHSVGGNLRRWILGGGVLRGLVLLRQDRRDSRCRSLQRPDHAPVLQLLIDRCHVGPGIAGLNLHLDHRQPRDLGNRAKGGGRKSVRGYRAPQPLQPGVGRGRLGLHREHFLGRLVLTL